MTRTHSVSASGAQGRTTSAADWALDNVRWLIAGGVLILAAIFVFWIFRRSHEIRVEKGEAALLEAQTALAQGNTPLAQSDLQRLMTRYEGTPAATQAALVLGQLYYDQGEYQKGIEVLEKAAKEAEAQRAAIDGLIADGLSELGKPAEAAARYEQGATEAALTFDKNNFLSNAARAYYTAGNKDKAVSIWRELAKDETGSAAAEARIRLGEATVQPAARS